MRQPAVSIDWATGFLRCAPFVALLALTAACSAPDGDPLGTSREAASTPFANDKAAYDYFIGKGLSNFQAAGVVGNLDQESGVNPTISQAGGGVGRGIAQWSTGARWDTAKGDNVLEYAMQQGQSAMSLGLQLDFIWYELSTFPNYGLAPLKASTNITDATTAFEDKYEGCVYANYPECALPQRITYAKNVLAAFGANTGQGGAGGGGAGGGGASAGGGAGGTNAGGAVGSSGASVGGGAGVAGTAGSSAGSASVAGSPSVAGSGNVAGFPAASSDPGSSCTFARPSSPRSVVDGSLGFAGALLAVASTLRRSRRRRLSNQS